MRRLLIALLVFTAGCSTSVEEEAATTTGEPGAVANTTATTIRSFAGTIPAPEFPEGLAWINADEPIRLADLTGKIVLLDFWTYGCINCIHIIPDLQRLEEEYPSELVVIGVHSAKFTNESETANIEEVVRRYGVEHPVVNDKDFEVWQSWNAQAWPTVALIDPAGKVVGTHAGEGVYEVVQPIVEALVTEFADAIDRTAVQLPSNAAGRPNTVLSYPGKVAVGDGLLFVSDTAHHRVVAAKPDTGEIVAVYGTSMPGFRNGEPLESQFDSPQGLAFDAATGTLYVADTNNHAIRTVDVATGQVATLTGTGQLGWPPASALLSDARLNSPWGLALRDGDLWIAMAGFHQIWKVDLDGGIATPVVGSGAEGTTNGFAVDASLAQPSGLAFDAGGRLYVADSESSSIRWADMDVPGGQTGTLAGPDTGLFDFGDEDGTGGQVRLQHPLGIVWDSGSGDLIIADTYNNKLKRIDPATGDTATYLGGSAGWADGSDPQFYEPGGLAIDNGTLYVADTNNHVVRAVDLANGTVDTVVLHGIETFTPPPDDSAYTGSFVELDAVEVSPGAGEIRLDIELPSGYKVNPDAPSSITWAVGNAVVDLPMEVDLTGAELPVSIPVEFLSGTGDITGDLTLLYCRTDSEGLCIIEQVRFHQPLSVTSTGTDRIDLHHEVRLPDF